MYTYVLLFLLIYILYRFIVGFVLPVTKASRTMHQKMRNMNDQMNGGFTTDGDSSIKKPGHNSASGSKTKPSSKDYIDFEEIK